MCRRWWIGALALVLFGGTACCVQAQDPVWAEVYGTAVQHFFAHDYEKAHELLTEAIEQGTQDPRCYYFRGLTYLRTGRPELAAADFKKGSQLEATGDERVHAVSAALQRIQGSERLGVEQYRQVARAAVRERALAAEKAREAEREKQARILQQAPPPPPPAPPLPTQAEPPVQTPAVQPVAKGSAIPPAAPAPTAEDPFGIGPSRPSAAAEGSKASSTTQTPTSSSSGGESSHSASAPTMTTKGASPERAGTGAATKSSRRQTTRPASGKTGAGRERTRGR